MSAGDARDLSGAWHGIFNYPHSAPPTDFEATITDLGGALVGCIAEIDPATGETLTATLDGGHTGSRVHFTKFYETKDEDFDTVFYEGQVAADGLEIHGRWNIPGAWSGSFIMIRAKGSEAAIEAEIAQTVRQPFDQSVSGRASTTSS